MAPTLPSPADDPQPIPPEPLQPNECCESGCDPCVYDCHAEEMRQYREQLARWLERHPAGAA
ncbi:hypothetical protein GCM10010975_32970 [Comamonas phosphati]|nr:hypothetical protein GCM10010975_32970 [Comamonas phosphati]